MATRLNYYEYNVRNESIERFCDAYSNNLASYGKYMSGSPAGSRLEHQEAFRWMTLMWPDKLTRHLGKGTPLTIATIRFD